jgi:glucan biosynthesis protein
MNSIKLVFETTFYMAVIPRPAQAENSKTTENSGANLNCTLVFFMTLLIISSMIFNIIRYRKSKERFSENNVEFQTLDFFHSGKVESGKVEINQYLNSESKKQIETLERIWKNSP